MASTAALEEEMLNLVHYFLTRLPPETSHTVGLKLLNLLPFKLNVEEESLTVETKFGRLKNPVGLAAGFDKQGKYIKQLSKLGFGYIVAGTATKNPRKGMRKPRIVRRWEERALVNAMGFPNPGIEKFVENIKSAGCVECPIVASVADEDPANLLECYDKIQPAVSAVEINISSPNTPQLRRYFQKDEFKQVAEMLRQRRQKPTYLKIPPTSNQLELEMVNAIVKIWHDEGFDGITAVNALLVDEPGVAAKRGGLSGKPLFPYMIKCVENIRKMFNEDFEVNAVGGIFSGADIFETLVKGSKTVQIYTAIVYRGPTVVRDMLNELLQIMRSKNIHSLQELELIAKRQESSSSF